MEPRPRNSRTRVARRPAARRPPVRTPIPPKRPVKASRFTQGLGLIAGVAALAAGGVAAGLELERRIVSKRIYREAGDEGEEFFALRSEGPAVLTPDGVVLHTEVDEPDVDHPGYVGDDLTLVFVHGYALSLDCWHFQRRHYRGAIRQVFYDQRSHGRSGRSDPERCRIPQLAEDLSQILEEVAGSGPVILVGHSMGSMTIMRLAQQHPEWFGDRVRGVALFSTSAGDMADYSPIKGLPGRTFSRIAPPLMATLNRIPELVEKSRKAGTDMSYVVTRRMSFGSDVPPSYVEFMSQMLGDTPLEVVADFYPAFGQLDEFVAFSVLSQVETAVVGGIDDVITPIRYTDRIIELLPGAESLRLPECGHMGIIEHHPQFNKVLDHLIERVRRHLND
jgi:pimeloyl-ACP methyl ester carboxylesterase